MSNKLLFTISTYNQLNYTKECIASIKKLENEGIDIDLWVFDDASTDETAQWCIDNEISIDKSFDPRGLTHSWNRAYKRFKENADYKYIIIGSNDIIVPKGSIRELVDTANMWPFSVVVPFSTKHGAGHNGAVQGIETIFTELHPTYTDNPINCQKIQDSLLNIKNIVKGQNNIYLLDPVRLKMFNGFFFMMNRKVIEYEQENGDLFDSTKPLYKGEDEFNWTKLIPNNDFSALCKTSFIFHYKGKSTVGFNNRDNLEEFIERRKMIDSGILVKGTNITTASK